MKKLTIVVADDNPIDKFLHAKIASELGHHVLAVVEDGIELINACRQYKPQLVISDTIMPKKDGISACKIIKQEYPITKCLCATSFADLSFPAQIKNVGVDAYLLKGFAAIKLNMAIQHIWSGQFYIDPLMHQDLIRSLKPIKKQLSELSELSELSSHYIIAHNGEHIKITDRHILLVSAIYHNLKREEIADLMNISPNTVDMNIKRIKNKMGVENRLTLIQLFSDWGLLQPVAFKNKQN